MYVSVCALGMDARVRKGRRSKGGIGSLCWVGVAGNCGVGWSGDNVEGRLFLS
jgi:hypothetical protein